MADPSGEYSDPGRACVPYTDSSCDHSAGVTLGYAGPSFGWTPENGGINDAANRGAYIDRQTGLIVETGTTALADLNIDLVIPNQCPTDSEGNDSGHCFQFSNDAFDHCNATSTQFKQEKTSWIGGVLPISWAGYFNVQRDGQPEIYGLAEGPVMFGHYDGSAKIKLGSWKSGKPFLTFQVSGTVRCSDNYATLVSTDNPIAVPPF